jgi:hypothetical protein
MKKWCVGAPGRSEVDRCLLYTFLLTFKIGLNTSLMFSSFNAP